MAASASPLGCRSLSNNSLARHQVVSQAIKLSENTLAQISRERLIKAAIGLL
jgi:hypothetical protein